MSGSIENLSLLLVTLGIFAAAGLGIVAWLTPLRLARYSVFLSPLVGAILVTSVALLKLDVFHVQLNSQTTFSVLIVLSAFLTYLHRRKILFAIRTFRKQDAVLLLIPFLHLLVVALTFQRDGLHLLQGGQDELLYSATARHMMTEMHTGSSNDTPAPRQDYYVYDWQTRYMAYTTNHRHAPEAVLASLAQVLGLNPEETFPILAEVFTVLLVVSIGFLGRVIFRRSLLLCLVIQAFNVGAYYLLALHVQGSLANIVSLPYRMLAPALVFYSLGWGAGLRVITGAVVAGVIIFYPETFVVGIGGPIIATLIFHHPRRLMKRVAKMLPIATIALGLSHIALMPAYTHSASNIEGGLSSISGQLQPPASNAKQQKHEMQNPNWWNHSTMIMGLVSYHDPSAWNQKINTFLLGLRSVEAVIYVLAALLSLWGYFRLRSAPAFALGITLTLWMLIVVLMVRSPDFLRFYRSFQYAMPLLLTGLGLAAETQWRLRRTHDSSTRVRVAGILSLLISVPIVSGNAFTVARTRWVIAYHSYEDSPIINRFNPSSRFFQSLLEELKTSRQTPVLISGYKESVRPFLLACALRTRPHFLGESVFRAWPILQTHRRPLEGNAAAHIRRQYPLYSLEEVTADFQRQNRIWWEVLSEYATQSLQAVVPPGAVYPVEWESWRDVFPARRKNFANLCDVVYKLEKDVVLPGNIVSEILRDASGPYRVLKGSGPLMVTNRNGEAFQVAIEYEGRVGDISLATKNGILLGSVQLGGDRVILVATVSYIETFSLSIESTQNPKLRAIRWTAINPSETQIQTYVK